MKKHLGILFILVMTFAMQTIVLAAPKTMPDGTIFDTIIYYDNSGATNNGIPCTSMTIRQIPIGK